MPTLYPASVNINDAPKYRITTRQWHLLILQNTCVLNFIDSPLYMNWVNFIWALVLISTTSEMIPNRGSTVCNPQCSSQWPYPHLPMGMTNTVFIIYVCFYILVIIYIIIHSNGMFCDVKYCVIFRWETGEFYSWFFLIYPKYCVYCNLLYFPVVVYLCVEHWLFKHLFLHGSFSFASINVL